MWRTVSNARCDRSFGVAVQRHDDTDSWAPQAPACAPSSAKTPRKTGAAGAHLRWLPPRSAPSPPRRNPDANSRQMLQDFMAVSGRRFSRVRVAHWQGPMVEGSGAVIAAGTHSDPASTVSVWNASVAGDARYADRLLDHEEEILDKYARPPLSYRVDGDVAALEFWGVGYGREDGSMRLWAGTSTGSVSLLSAQRYENETDAEGRRLETWQVMLSGPCPSAVASAVAGDTRVI